MKIAETETTAIFRTDTAGMGGAHHSYEIRDKAGDVLCEVNFQNGPVSESGINGVQHLDLLVVIRDRLDLFQMGSYASAINESTCAFVSAALACDETRTRRRTHLGVEGTIND